MKQEEKLPTYEEESRDQKAKQMTYYLEELRTKVIE